jgi:hypothetical protein
MPARLTLDQAARAFNVSKMTLYSWRHGIGGKKGKLPVLIENPESLKPRVFVPVREAQTWARANGMEFNVENIEGTFGASGKPGPKPKIEPDRRTKRALEAH